VTGKEEGHREGAVRFTGGALLFNHQPMCGGALPTLADGNHRACGVARPPQLMHNVLASHMLTGVHPRRWVRCERAYFIVR
jgi:hypothetical protein